MSGGIFLAMDGAQRGNFAEQMIGLQMMEQENQARLAKQELEEAERLQKEETKRLQQAAFEAEQRRLDEQQQREEEERRVRHYQNNLADGKKDMAEGKFQDAINEFERALHYKPKDTIVTFNIACCHAGMQDFPKAIQLLYPLIKNEHSIPGFAAMFGNCEREMIARANFHLQNANAHIMQNNLNDSLAELSLAEGFAPKTPSGELIAHQIEDLKLSIAWGKIREKTNANYAEAENFMMQNRFVEARDLLKQLNETYSTYAHFLDPHEQDLRQKVAQLLVQAQRAVDGQKDRELQGKINLAMPAFIHAVQNFEVDEAIVLLQAIKAQCDAILYPEDVQSYGYIPADLMGNELQNLQRWLTAYNQRRDSRSRALADAIVTPLQNEISTEDANVLRDGIEQAAKQYWHELDRRDLTALQTALSNYISEHLYEAGTLLKLLCCYSKLYIPYEEQEQFKIGLRDSVFNHLPQEQREAIVLQMLAPAMVDNTKPPLRFFNSNFNNAPLAVVQAVEINEENTQRQGQSCCMST